MCFFRRKKKQKTNETEVKEIEIKEQPAETKTTEVDNKPDDVKTKNCIEKSDKATKSVKKTDTTKKSTTTKNKTVKSEDVEKGESEEQKSRKAIYRVMYDKEARVWIIKKDGAKRKIASFPTKEAALTRVKELAETNELNFIVHKKDGKFQKK